MYWKFRNIFYNISSLTILPKPNILMELPMLDSDQEKNQTYWGFVIAHHIHLP